MTLEEKIQNITSTIVKTVDPEKVVLFGSMASGQSGENSDIDLCIIKNNVNDKIRELVKVRGALRGTGWPMDLLLMSAEELERRKDVWGTIQYEIDKKGKMLYERRN